MMCEICEDEGMTFDGATNTARFCSCATGQRRQRLYDAHQADIKAKAKARADRLIRKPVHDYKAEAAGNGERERQPGEDDNDVPF